MSTEPAPPPATDAPPADQGKAPAPSPDSKPDTGPETDWKALAEKAQADVEKWKNLSRKHEDRARSNAEAASQAQTVEQQLEDLRKAMAERDVKDIERSGRLALTQVKAKLAEAGLSAADADGFLEHIDAVTLLAEGEPDGKAIDKLAGSLIKTAGRTTPDRDQGRKGGDTPPNMTQLIRRSAGYGSQ